jgi:GMP synthase-like glutamine amidotransferase
MWMELPQLLLLLHLANTVCMPKPLLILQHYWCETPGVFLDVLRDRDIPTVTLCGANGDPYPSDLSAHSGVIAMGGPMGVYEEEQYPWLRQEDALLKIAIQRNMPTLGICLGSQLVAKAAGAEVKPGDRKEIGWYDITLSDEGIHDPLWKDFPSTFEAFEWHGDIFSLRPGAVSLASSALYSHQAFRIGQRVYAVLFHLEVTTEMIQTWMKAFAGELATVRSYLDPAAIEQNLANRATRMNALAQGFMKRFCELL